MSIKNALMVTLAVLALGPAPGRAQEAQKTREQEIQELRKIIQELQQRLEALETAPKPAPQPQSAGATQLPNISVIGNLVQGAGDSRRIENRGRSNLRELELAFQDAVSPKLRYDFFLAAAKEEEWGLGLEEGFLTAVAPLPGLTLRAGRIRTPIGKFNPLHPHVWPFITAPSAQTALLGPEGLNADGMVAQYVLPWAGVFSQVEFGVWQTASEVEDGLGFGAGEKGAFSGRWWLGKEVGRNRELEFGVSRYQGRGTIGGVGRQRKSLTGLDVTYRGFLGAGRRYRLSAELYDHATDVPMGGAAHRLGGFAYATYRWNPFWEAGVRGDYTRTPWPIDGVDYGGSAFLTRYITEQTSLRVEYQYQRSPLLGSGSAIYLQLLFGSGPHAHPIQ